MDPTYVSINEQMDKENGVHMENTIPYSLLKEEILSFIITRMGLEDIMLR